MMSVRATVVALVFLTASGPASAQSPYQPYSPRISPWFGLFQRNTGPLDNYHSFVRPQMQLQNRLREQSSLLNEQGAGLQSLSGNLNRMEAQGAAPTGAGSVFMNYSHYYSVPGSAGWTGGAAAAVRSRSTWTKSPAHTNYASGAAGAAGAHRW